MPDSSKSLDFFLIDSLSDYSEDFQIARRSNPVQFRLNGQDYIVHVSSVHDSGEGRPNADEERIQISRANRELLAERARVGCRTAFIGFFPDGRVFTAWDSDYVFSLRAKDNGTIYARLSHNAQASNYGAAARVFKPKYVGPSVEVALRSEALGFYLENRDTMHSVRGDAEIQAVVAAISRDLESGQKSGTDEADVVVGGQRKIVTVTRTAFRRDPKFREAIMNAYGGSCCVCGRQLGLVEAAHIIPHGNDDSNDDVTNGLALCAEHHRLYDTRLLLPHAQQRLFLNLERVEHLRNIGQDSGLDEITALAAQQYRVPDHVPSRPNDGFLERGVRIRLGTDA